jgi:His/Glu/Gln/Arg/opine family amino acid ABC transporter permease subunit
MDFSLVLEQLLPQLPAALLRTLELTLFSLALGFSLALPTALARMSKSRALSWPAHAFIFYFRGTPFFVQLFLIYYGSGQFRPELQSVGLWVFFREAWFCGILTLTLNTAAYTAEIIRGGILSVAHGEIEAGRAIGMTRAQVFRRIVFPQALKQMLPAYSNEAIQLMHATSVVSVITILELVGTTRIFTTKYFAIFEGWITVALVYLALTLTMSAILRAIERSLGARPRKPGQELARGEPVEPPSEPLSR